MAIKTKHILVLTICAYIFLMLGNGIVSLTNPDEVFYVQTAKEMAQQKTWSTPYLFGAPQFEKPILLYWFIRASMLVFGNINFAGRFPGAFFAILGVIAVYLLSFIGLKSEKKAFVAGLVLMSSGLYIGLARSVFTDMIFSVFILFSLLAFYWGYTFPKRKGIGIILFFVSSALAVLAKGPLGISISLAIVAAFLFVKKDLKYFYCREFLWGVLSFLLICLPWYLLMEFKYGKVFNREFFYNDHFMRLIRAEHIENDRWYFYPFTMVGAMFPWSIYCLLGLIFLFKSIKRNVNDFNLFLFLWVAVVFLTFQFAHSKLTSYIFPLFPALAIISAGFICDIYGAGGKKRTAFITALIMSVFFLLIPVALIIAMPKYVAYINSKNPVYALIAAFFILAAGAIVFTLSRKYAKLIFIIALFPLIILFASGFIHEDIEPYVSSREACSYLLKNYSVKGVILASKFYLRGVRFYTGREAACVDIPGTNFFSPHPVIFLDSDAKVRAFLDKQPVTYGILKKGNVKDFQSLTDKYFKFEILKEIGNEYVVRISPLA